MVDQASVNGRGTARAPGSGSAQLDGVAEFVDDLASLAELQARLAAVDFRESARQSAFPLVLTVVSLAVLLASVPVALFGAGWLLASAMKIDQGWAMLIIAGAAMAVAGLGGGGGGGGGGGRGRGGGGGARRPAGGGGRAGGGAAGGGGGGGGCFFLFGVCFNKKKKIYK